MAEGRDADDDDGQRQRLKEQVQGAGLDMLVEKEQPKQTRPQRIKADLLAFARAD